MSTTPHLLMNLVAPGISRRTAPSPRVSADSSRLARRPRFKATGSELLDRGLLSRRAWLAQLAMALPAAALTFPQCLAADPARPAWNRRLLQHVPRVFPAPDLGGPGVRSLFLEGPLFRCKPTRIFAFYGLPKAPPAGRAPALVLVHGGGGTAFADWVRLWTGRGYAALAMDTCGCVPIGAYGNWQRHDQGGPPGWGGLDQTDWPLEDQWMHQAVATILCAHSWLRAQPEVDPGHIGLTGISWGGVLTCLAASVDRRFRFAAPVYGCGFLGGKAVNGSLDGLFDRGPLVASARWLRWWDPRWFLPEAHMPFLWLNGTNDFAFPLPAWRASTRLPRGPRTLCLRVRMPHAHGGPGENPEEIHTFANALCGHGHPLARVRSQQRRGQQILVDFQTVARVARAELCCTRDTGRWQDRRWETVPASVDRPGRRAHAELPGDATAWFLNLVQEPDLVTSTEPEEV